MHQLIRKVFWENNTTYEKDLKNHHSRFSNQNSYYYFYIKNGNKIKYKIHKNFDFIIIQ